jgi:hypothetical protein
MMRRKQRVRKRKSPKKTAQVVSELNNSLKPRNVSPHSHCIPRPGLELAVQLQLRSLTSSQQDTYSSGLEPSCIEPLKLTFHSFQMTDLL